MTRSPRHPVTPSPRLSLTALLVLTATISLQAQSGPMEAARRAASAAVRGPRSVFLDALDVDAPLEARLGTTVWRDLTESQRELLRSAVREGCLAMLAPGNPATSEVAWSAALPPSSDGEVDVLIGLRLAEKTLKTRWRMRPSASGWRVRDVVLSGLGERRPPRGGAGRPAGRGAAARGVRGG